MSPKSPFLCVKQDDKIENAMLNLKQYSHTNSCMPLIQLPQSSTKTLALIASDSGKVWTDGMLMSMALSWWLMWCGLLWSYLSLVHIWRGRIHQFLSVNYEIYPHSLSVCHCQICNHFIPIFLSPSNFCLSIFSLSLYFSLSFHDTR